MCPICKDFILCRYVLIPFLISLYFQIEHFNIRLFTVLYTQFMLYLCTVFTILISKKFHARF